MHDGIKNSDEQEPACGREEEEKGDKMSYNNQKKIALINDFTGFGRCSIAVALPVISMLKVQCCPLPTSIFSNHTGFPSFFFDDYTEKMIPYMEEWKKLDLKFSGISTGFLGSKEQIRIVISFLESFKTKENLVIVDHGRLWENVCDVYAGDVPGNEKSGVVCKYSDTQCNGGVYFDRYAVSGKISVERL